MRRSNTRAVAGMFAVVLVFAAAGSAGMTSRVNYHSCFVGSPASQLYSLTIRVKGGVGQAN